MSKEKKKIFWINGTINSGKTTIANLLASENKNIYHIELDELSNSILDKELDDKLEIVIRKGLELAVRKIDEEKIPIITWPLYNEELDFALALAKNLEVELKLITLTTNFEKAISQRTNRILSNWEKSRIRYHIEECKINSQNFDYKVDNSDLSIEETLELISKLIEN